MSSFFGVVKKTMELKQQGARVCMARAAEHREGTVAHNHQLDIAESLLDDAEVLQKTLTTMKANKATALEECTL